MERRNAGIFGELGRSKEDDKNSREKVQTELTGKERYYATSHLWKMGMGPQFVQELGSFTIMSSLKAGVITKMLELETQLGGEEELLPLDSLPANCSFCGLAHRNMRN